MPCACTVCVCVCVSAVGVPVCAQVNPEQLVELLKFTGYPNKTLEGVFVSIVKEFTSAQCAWACALRVGPSVRDARARRACVRLGVRACVRMCEACACGRVWTGVWFPLCWCAAGRSFLEFVTAQSALNPSRKIEIRKDTNTAAYPVAHTCFARLDCPGV